MPAKMKDNLFLITAGRREEKHLIICLVNAEDIETKDTFSSECKA